MAVMMFLFEREDPSSPLLTISKDDQGGLIAILTAFALTLVLTAITLRIYVGYKNGPWKRDDGAFVVASVCQAIQHIVESCG